MSELDTDVAIVGFGPVGALLAALLGRRGVRVAVIEREADVYPLPRAAHIDHQGLRLLQEIGCLDALLPDMMVNPGIDFTSGTIMTIQFDNPVDAQQLRDAFGTLGHPEAVIRLRSPEFSSRLTDCAVHCVAGGSKS